ncbi:hypothetical protein SISNIDRAFT_491389 [Sistotremastrum niveocremeum HHB9708]|uniref:Mixed lineage kinase domain-containing protein n=1 Tax=Sistotremastrum niveocremeum HHB9708 TaxID=1314777 RepID=A0A164MU78_9AGAM|nr:hypothetical protein SISNIDRAFT_491389 [Sistotremastrum niveocremeum HHB9708]
MPLTADVNANLLRSLKIVQSLGEAVPHGGVLKAVAGIGITFLETAERVRLNKEECADIARRAAEDIGVLRRLNEDEELSEDLIGRLERYHKILETVLQKVEQLGTEAGWKRTLRASSVQEETKECLDRLNEAFRMYMFQFSLAADIKLTKILNRMEVMSLSAESTIPADPEEPDEIRRIRTEHITFLEEISCKKMRGYTVRFGKARMVDRAGHQKAVIVKKFQTMDACEDAARDAFDNEVEIRRDLLHASFARMLGVSIASRRTKIIVIEAGTIAAYDYLQNLPSLEYLLEHMRIMCEFVVRDVQWTGYSATNRWQAGYRFLGEHGGSWRGGYRDVLLSAKDKQLRMGGLGKMDGRWKDSGWRMDEAFYRLRDGNDRSEGASVSFEEIATQFERMRESATKWNEEETEENGRDLFGWLSWWCGSSEYERGTENSPSVGEIGWIDRNEWHPIPLVHHFPIAPPLQYNFAASRWRDGEWDTIVGTRIGEYTRWSIDISPGEEIYLDTFVRFYRPQDMANFFIRSALSLAKDFGVDVCSLRLVSCAGFNGCASLTISDEQFSTIYYFAYSPQSDGSVPDPPGFWSSCPDPLCSACRLETDAAPVVSHARLSSMKGSSSPSSLSFEISSHTGFLTVPDITHVSDPPFASITELSDQHAPDSVISKPPKKRFGDALLSAFTKKKKTS